MEKDLTIVDENRQNASDGATTESGSNGGQSHVDDYSVSDFDVILCSDDSCLMSEVNLRALNSCLSTIIRFTRRGDERFNDLFVRCYHGPVVRFVDNAFRQFSGSILNDTCNELVKIIGNRLIEYGILRLEENCDLTARIFQRLFSPFAYFHQQNKTELSVFEPAEDQVQIACPCVVNEDSPFTCGTLIDFLNYFGHLGGLEKLRLKFSLLSSSEKPMQCSLIDSVLCIFRQPFPFLSPEAVDDYLIPMVRYTFQYLTKQANGSSEPGGGKSNVGPKDYFRLIDKALCLIERVIINREDLRTEMEDRMLDVVLGMLRLDRYVFKQQSFEDLSRLMGQSIENTGAPSVPRIARLMEWWKRERILDLIMRDAIHKAAFQIHMDNILSCLTRAGLLSNDDLDYIWSFQYGRQAAVAKNAREMVVGVISTCDDQLLTHLFFILKTLWDARTSSAQREVCRLLMKMNEIDTENLRTRRILTFIWELVHSQITDTQNLSASSCDLLVSTFERVSEVVLLRVGNVLPRSSGIYCGDLNRPFIKTEFLQLFVEVLRSNAPESIVAIKLICSIIDLCHSSTDSDEHRYQTTRMVDSLSRNAVIRRLHHDYCIVEIVLRNLAAYMEDAKYQRATNDGYTHREQVEQRLILLTYIFHKTSAIKVNISDAECLWKCLVNRGIEEDDAEIMFDFFSKIVSLQRSCDAFTGVFGFVYELIVAEMDPRRTKLSCIRAMWALFCSHAFGTIDANDIHNPSILMEQRIKSVLSSDFKGRRFIWKVVSECEDEKCANWLRDELVKVYTSEPILDATQCSILDLNDDRKLSLNQYNLVAQSMAMIEQNRSDVKALRRISSTLFEYVLSCDKFFGCHCESLANALYSKFVTLTLEKYCCSRDCEEVEKRPENRTYVFHQRNTVNDMKREIEQVLNLPFPMVPLFRMGDRKISRDIEDRQLVCLTRDLAITLTYDDEVRDMDLTIDDHIDDRIIPSVFLTQRTNAYKRLIELSASVEDVEFSFMIQQILLRCSPSKDIQQEVKKMVTQLSGREKEDACLIESFFSPEPMPPMTLYRLQILGQFLNVYSTSDEENVELAHRFYERGGTDFILTLLDEDSICYEALKDTRVHLQGAMVTVTLIHQLVSLIAMSRAVREKPAHMERRDLLKQVHRGILEKHSAKRLPSLLLGEHGRNMVETLQKKARLLADVKAIEQNAQKERVRASVVTTLCYEIAQEMIYLLHSLFLAQYNPQVKETYQVWLSDDQRIYEFFDTLLFKCECPLVRKAAGELAFALMNSFLSYSDHNGTSHILRMLIDLLQRNIRCPSLQDGYNVFAELMECTQPDLVDIMREVGPQLTMSEIQAIQKMADEKDVSQASIAFHFDICAAILKHQSDEFLGSLTTFLLFIHEKCLHTRNSRIYRRCCICGRPVEESSFPLLTDECLCTSFEARCAAYSAAVELCRIDEHLMIFRASLHRHGLNNRRQCVRCSETVESVNLPLSIHSPASTLNEYKARKQGHFVGLRNAGATCYANAVLQQMFMNRTIRDIVLTTDLPTPPPILKMPFQLSNCLSQTGRDGSSSGEANEGIDLCSVNEVDDGTTDETHSACSESSLTVNLDEEDDEDTTVVTCFASAAPSSPTNRNPDDQPLETFQCLQLTFAYLMESLSSVYSPREFLSAFKFFGQEINPYEQHDAVEFLQMLVDTVDKAFTTHKLPPVFSRILSGAFETVTECTVCRRRSVRPEEFCFVSVDVVNAKDLKESLEQYTGGELMEGLNAYECEHCRKKVEAVMRTKFRRCGQILGFQLKRFIDNGGIGLGTGVGMDAHKYNNRFEFPKHLSMLPYMCKEAIQEAEEKSRDFEYELKGVVIHTGGLAHGHYYSFILNDGTVCGEQGKWYKFDDNEVYQVEGIEKVLEKYCYGVNGDPSSAYMLFYEREWTRKEQANPIRDLIPLDRRCHMTEARIPENVYRHIHSTNIRILENQVHGRSDYYAFVAHLMKRHTSSSVSLDTHVLESAEDDPSRDQQCLLRTLTATDALMPLIEGSVLVVNNERVDFEEPKTSIPKCIRHSCLEILDGILALTVHSFSARTAFLTQVCQFQVLYQTLVRFYRPFRCRFSRIIEALLVRQMAVSNNEESLVLACNVIQCLINIMSRLFVPKETHHAQQVIDIFEKLRNRGPKTIKGLLRISLLQRLARAVFAPDVDLLLSCDPTWTLSEPDRENLGDIIRPSIRNIVPLISMILFLVRCPRYPNHGIDNPYKVEGDGIGYVISPIDYELIERNFPISVETIMESTSILRLLLHPDVAVHEGTSIYVKFICYKNIKASCRVVGIVFNELYSLIDVFPHKRITEITIDPFVAIPSLCLIRSCLSTEDDLKEDRFRVVLRGTAGGNPADDDDDDDEPGSRLVRGLLEDVVDWLPYGMNNQRAIIIVSLLMEVSTLTPRNWITYYAGKEALIERNLRRAVERIRNDNNLNGRRINVSQFVERAFTFLAKITKNTALVGDVNTTTSTGGGGGGGEGADDRPSRTCDV